MLKVVIWQLFFSYSEKPSEIKSPLPTLVHLDLAKHKLLEFFLIFNPLVTVQSQAIIVCQETTLLILFSLTYNINVLKYAWKTITRVH